MATGEFFESLLGKQSNGSLGNFYKPIDRTNDLIYATKLRGIGGIRPPELYIAPPSAPLGALPTQLISALNGLLVLREAPSAEEIARSEIGDLCAAYGGGDPHARNVLLRALQELELTGEITAAARRLNEARLSPVERALLSRGNIALYALYRAAVGMRVKDVDGITSNTLSSLDKVKSYLNRNLVKEVLVRENLAHDPRDLAELQNRFADRNLSYREGEAERSIIAEYREIKGRSSVIAACEEFLSRGIVNVPPGLDRELLIKRMIAYLEAQGFRPAVISGLAASFKTRETGLRVQFEDTSTDDGRIIEWRWLFGDGGTSNDQNPVHAYGAPGAYQVQLTVTDNDGNEASSSESVTVRSVTPASKLKIKYNSTPISDPHFASRVDLRVEGAGARITQSRWEFGDGNNANAGGPTIQHSYARSGSYTVKVEAIDDEGTSGTATQLVEVRAVTPRQEPYVIIGRVIEEHDKKPAAGKVVRAFANKGVLGMPQTTLDDGTFEIRYAMPDTTSGRVKSRAAELLICVYSQDGEQKLLSKEIDRILPRLDVGDLVLKQPPVAANDSGKK